MLLVCLLHKFSRNIQGHFHIIMVIWVLNNIVLSIAQILLVVLNILPKVITEVIIDAFFLLLVSVRLAFYFYYTQWSICKVLYDWIQSCGWSIDDPFCLLSDWCGLRFFRCCYRCPIQVDNYCCAIVYSTDSLCSCVSTYAVCAVLAKVRFAEVS
jgi:hypothetical protein